ncbi:enhanced serine sensitivity protein SseB [Lacrimispora amygdalina]|uniref:Enhanced serine sensitivity protein SseB n=1 Tax=Lacrimispora amygdalina TaxID=253257 RepID=A0ABQ5MCH0_9FIRM
METIQEIIKKFEATKDKQIYSEIIERIKTKELLLISYMPFTNNYYLDFENGKPACYIFTEKKYYDEYQDYMMQQQIIVKHVENNEEQRMLMFGDLYRSGFEMIVIDSGQTHLVISLFDIIDKPDFSDVPEIKRPIMNPSLVCAANHFFQGLSTKRVTRDMEANMFKEIYNAKYLMPLDTSKMNMEKTNADNGECVVKEKSIMQFPLITNSEDKSFYPFFTDWNEFRRFDKEQKFSGNIATFEDIKYFIDKADGISINPYGVNITLTKDMLNVIESAAEGSLQNTVIKEQVAEKESKVMLGEPAEYPQKMIDEICKYLKTNKNVNAAYLRLMVKDNEQSYLIVVDFSGDKNVVFSSIANAGVPFSNGKYLDLVPLSSGFGKEAVENIIPFYKKKKFGIF